jgi:hypothetical protein
MYILFLRARRFAPALSAGIRIGHKILIVIA